MLIKIILIILVSIFICYPIKEGLFIEDWESVNYSYKSTNKIMIQQHYKKLMKHFDDIFPNRNRNTGGPQFYHFIDSHKENLTKDKYILYNTFYCAVSGSPIDPNREDKFNYVIVKHINNKKYIGKFFRCCKPCLADIMKYTKVEHHTINLKDGPYKHLVLTINDPCKYKDKIPDEVTSFKCSDKTLNGVHTKSGKLIIGVLHNYKKYNSKKHYKKIKYSLDISKDRMNTDPDKLKYGMGDIFVKLATLNKS